MNKEQYDYTVTSLAADCDSLESAKVSLEYLVTLGADHPDKAALTPEMQAAFRALAAACADFIGAYRYYLPLLQTAATEPPEAL